MKYKRNSSCKKWVRLSETDSRYSGGKLPFTKSSKIFPSTIVEMLVYNSKLGFRLISNSWVEKFSQIIQSMPGKKKKRTCKSLRQNTLICSPKSSNLCVRHSMSSLHASQIRFKVFFMLGKICVEYRFSCPILAQYWLKSSSDHI